MALLMEITNPQDIERNPRKILKTTETVCTTCDRKLGDMIEANPKLANDTEIKHVFVCPCGGNSFTVKVTHTAYFLAGDGLITTSIVEVSSNKFKSKLENYDGE